jgi:hypothetical protein
MFNRECASLILRTNDLTAGATNAVGSADTSLTNFTWNNINLRTLLGAMYDKYDKFCLVPVYIQSANGSSNFGSLPDDKVCSININGLPFINNNYNFPTLTNQSSAVFNVVRFITNSTTSTPYTYGNILTFTKNQELVNINIFYQRINKNAAGNYSIQTAFAFPHCIFTFNIYGIPKDVGDINASRMF